MRWVLILLLVTGSADAFSRSRGRHHGTRSPNSGIVAQYLMTAASECTCAAVTGTRGEAITVSRSSSATCTKSDGTLVTCSADQPRVEADGLLVEASATNLALRSEEFDNAAWTPDSSVTRTANQGVAPDGNTTADLVNNTAATSLSSVYQTVTVSSSAGPFTYSVYAAKQSGTGPAGVIAICGGSTSVSACTCEREDGTACTASTSGTQCRVYSTHSTTPTRIALHVTCAATVTSVIAANVPGQPGASTGTALFWGAQLETGSIATSYIATAGTSATRAADNISVSTTGWPVAVGSMALDYTPLWASAADNGSGRVISVRDASNGWEMYLQTNATVAFGTPSSVSASGVLSWAQGTTYRLRATWGGGSRTIYRDGTSVKADTGKTDPASIPATAYIGRYAPSAVFYAQGYLKNICIGRTEGACQ